MLSRTYRFHGHGGVRRVYRLGRPARAGLATVHVLTGEKVRGSRVAVVVSRKVDKSAVRRNRIRRRVYEIVRAKLPELKQPAELVITIYQPEAATMSAAELRRTFDQLFKKAKF